LRLAKTKVACLEEKLAQHDLGDFSLSSPQQVNVTVNATNYGCFGLGGIGSVKIRLESPDQLRKQVKPVSSISQVTRFNVEQVKDKKIGDVEAENCTE
jgi:hypothetical protein